MEEGKSKISMSESGPILPEQLNREGIAPKNQKA